MFLRIESSSGVPISRQIADQIRRHSAAGVLRPGDRLPSVRQLAKELAVNPNTILHVYERLTAEGLLERHHGDGTYLSMTPPPGQAQSQLKSLLADLDRLAQRAVQLQVPPGEATALFEKAIARAAKAGATEHQEEPPMSDPKSAAPVIEMREVRKAFSRRAVLQGVNLAVSPGQTFAFLGRNGAGKTTTIRMLLGLLKPDSGVIRVLGIDPARDPLQIRRRVGYVAEDPVLFGWMRVRQLIAFVAPFYPTWDHQWAKQLADRFELPMETKFKHLSKGQGVRVALLLALAHRPELVILDDPTLGLDPIMRKEFLRDLVTYLQAERVTVFFSSHLLYEIEPVADAIVILDRGKVVRQAATEQLRAQVKRLLAPAEAEPLLRSLPGLLDLQVSGRQVSAVVSDIAAAEPLLAGDSDSVQTLDLNLDEIFEALVIGRVQPATPTPTAAARGVA